MKINPGFLCSPRSLKAEAIFLLFAALPAFVCILSDEISDFRKELPEAATVGFPDFSGRVFPRHEVHFGNSFISVPAGQINGEDAIATYGIFKSRDDVKYVEITYWKPDPKTPALFQRGELTKTSESLWQNRYVTIKSCELVDKTLFLYPGKNTGKFTEHVMFTSFAVILSVLIPAILWLIGITMAQKRRLER